MPCYLMQTDKNGMKVKKCVSMHLHAFERPCKRQIVTDLKSRNASPLKIFKNKQKHHSLSISRHDSECVLIPSTDNIDFGLNSKNNRIILFAVMATS